MLDDNRLSEDEYLTRLGRAARIKLTLKLLAGGGRTLWAAGLTAFAVWGATAGGLWGLLGPPLKALTGYPAAMAALGSASALIPRLSVFFILAAAAGAVTLISLNGLIAHCLEGEAPRGWEETAFILMAPWSQAARLVPPLIAWSLIAGLWGAALALVSLPPYAGLAPLAAGTAVFALLHNCAAWHLIHPENPGLWTAVALPFRLLAHSDVLWRKTLGLGLALLSPGLALTVAALSRLSPGPLWTALGFSLGALLMGLGATFFACLSALAYKQSLANYRLRRRPWPPEPSTPEPSTPEPPLAPPASRGEAEGVEAIEPL